MNKVTNWLKALLPISVLALGLALIVMAFMEAGGSYPTVYRDGAGVTGCFGDRDCERTYREEREARP